VFDFLSKGKMEIKLDKLSFAQGETINGSIAMQLKKPIKAKGVLVVLFAEQTNTRMTSKGMERYTQRIYEFKLPLDGEKEYGTQPYDYTFELKVPQSNQNKIGGVAGNVMTAVSLFTVGAGGPAKWYLEAKLDVPMGFDLGKKIQLNVG